MSKTSNEIVDRLNAAMVEALSDPALRFVPGGSNPRRGLLKNLLPISGAKAVDGRGLPPRPRIGWIENVSPQPGVDQEEYNR